MRLPCLVLHNSTLIIVGSIPQRFPILQHIFHARSGLLRRQQFHEVLAFEVEQPLFIHHAARFDIAAAHRFGDAAAYVVVVFGNEITFEHVDHRGFESGDAGAACHGYLARLQGWTVGSGGERFGFFLGNVQQFILVHHDAIRLPEIAHVAREFGALGDFAHRDIFEVTLQVGEDVDATIV
jgi:hypothetical protein